MYSGFVFFFVLILFAFILNTFLAPYIAQRFKKYILALATLGLGFLIFNSYYVLALVAWFYIILWLRKVGFFRNLSTAVIAILAPLVFVKFGSLSFLAVIGLSFMTFRAVDAVLNLDVKEKLDFVNYFNYIAMPFVALTGPMYRWKNYNQDIQNNFLVKKQIDYSSALYLIALGLIQKFLFADFVYREILINLDAKDFSLYSMMLNAVVYSVFLYFDFAGYSNMAIGSGKLFGFNLPQNFNNPLMSKNPQDFWRRWHMSLSFWLRDMIFMPLYMHLLRFVFFKKHRLLAQNIGIFMTLLVMGIWNGLQIKYIASGALFGTYSVIHNIIVHYAKQNKSLENFLNNNVISFLGRVITIVLAIFALYVFSGRSFIG